MPYKDPEVARMKSKESKRKYRAREHAKRYGDGAGDMRGRHGRQATGEGNGRWNASAKRITSEGYVAVRVPVDHPHAWGPVTLKRFRYAYEHVVVMMKHLGRAMVDGEVVHHKNGDRTDNRLDNLELMTAGEHQRYHSLHTRNRNSIGKFA
jgi:hypothetical protein